MHFVLRYAHKLLRLNNGLLFLFSLLFIIGSSIVAYLIEPDTFGNWFNSFYWVLTTMATVGYGDYFMVTAAGKVFSIFLYLFGIGLLSLVIGKIIEGFAGIKKRRETGKMNYPGKNHVVIITWNKKAHAAVEELISSDPGLEIVIIDENESLPYDHKRVHYVSGDPTSDETLLRAGLIRCKAAIIFADEKIDDYSLIDGRTLLIASSVEGMAPGVHTTVEVMLEKHIQNFRHAKVNNFVISHDAVSRLAVRSALNDGMTDLFRQLISRQHGEDIYEIAAKPGWRTYGDAYRELLKQGATLLADRGDLGINRKQNEEIPSGARLFVVCDAETYGKMTGGTKS